MREVVAARLPSDIVALGPWWNDSSSVEIDAVGVSGRARTPVLFGEAKWARTASAPGLIRALERKAETVPGAARDGTYVVCARDAVRDAPAGVIKVTATDILGT